MITFIGEEERTTEVKARFFREFELADNICRYWASVNVNSWLDKSGLDDTFIGVVMMLATQAARLFRSVLEECSRGEGLSGLILSRSLFETSLALEFVLAPTIRIKAVPKNSTDKFGNPRYVAVVGSNRLRPLSREFRARLYIYSTPLQEQSHVREVLAIKGLKRFGQMQTKKIKPVAIAAIEKEIGAPWCSILRGKRSYSGLGIDETVKVVGGNATIWYKLGYPLQCRASHAAEAWKMVQTSQDGLTNAVAFSDDGDISFALYCGTGFFLAVLSSLQDHIGFGMKNVLGAFDTEATKLYRGVKP